MWFRCISKRCQISTNSSKAAELTQRPVRRYRHGEARCAVVAAFGHYGIYVEHILYGHWYILLPAFTVGAASFFAVVKGLRLATGREVYLRISTFWTKIFAIAFGMES